jgi:hypothetical protein
MADEIQKITEGLGDFNFDELTVEELEQRLELAIGMIPGSPLNGSCVSNFACVSFVCATFGCPKIFS